MITFCVHAHCFKNVCQFIDLLAGVAVNNSAFIPVISNVIYYLVGGIALLHDFKEDVFAVEAGNVNLRIFHRKIFDYILAHMVGCRCRKGCHYGVREVAADSADFHVIRAEVMSPLGNAVSLIYCNQADFQIVLTEELPCAAGRKSFRRNIDDFYLALYDFFRGVAVFFPGQGRVEEN